MGIDFSGSAQRLTFPGSNIDGTAKLAFSLWFNKDDTSIARLLMLNDDVHGFQIAQNFDSGNRVNVLASRASGPWGGQTDGKLRGNTTSNIWHHVCGTVSVSDPNNKTLLSAYLDSVALTDDTGASANAGTSNGLVFTAARSDATSHFNGTLAEAAIWEGIEISVEQAAALANGLPAYLIESASLKFYAPLPEIDGVDLITGNAATKTGTPITLDHAPVISADIILINPTVVVGGARPQGPFGHVFYGPFAGPLG